MSKEHTYEISEKEMEKFNNWRKKKIADNGGEFYAGTVGGAWSFIFTPTGIGVIVEGRCMDGETINLTDFDNW
jgi:archaellum component FlaG (FlaF/FlaG flagellin family)